MLLCLFGLQVIYLDADNYVLRDPSMLFATKEYNATAAIFWQDFWDNTLAPEVNMLNVVDAVCSCSMM